MVSLVINLTAKTAKEAVCEIKLPLEVVRNMIIIVKNSVHLPE